MTQEEKKLLLEDLCNRLSYGVKCNVGEETPYTLSGIEIDDVNGHLFDFVEKKNGLNMQVYLSEVKPYLFPLSSMTDEQYDEYTDMGYSVTERWWSMANYHQINWFNKYHFDYRGLIEKGLAIDATNTNIYDNY